MRIFKSYGFNLVAAWESRFDEGPRFIYLLAWPDENKMKRAWERFRADEEWKEIKRDTNLRYGDLVGTIEEHVLIPTSYSPMMTTVQLSQGLPK
jgi:hypothetical protein